MSTLFRTVEPLPFPRRRRRASWPRRLLPAMRARCRARLRSLPALLWLPALSAPALPAMELTIQPQAFHVHHSFSATALPRQHTPLSLPAKSWREFTITRIAPHGSQVAKGDVLLAFDTRGIDQQIETLRRQIQAQQPSAEHQPPEAPLSAEQDRLRLALLEEDRKLFEITAPADGRFYFGTMEDGRWTTGESTKSLRTGGSAVAGQPFATFIPKGTPLELSAFLEEGVARSARPELKGVAILAGREDLEIPLQLLRLSAMPDPDQRYRADFQVTWPKDFPAFPGITATVHLLSYSSANAIVIPTSALSYGPNGWTAGVKLADGATEQRPVKRGRISGDQTEILSGLEPGQVILIP